MGVIGYSMLVHDKHMEILMTVSMTESFQVSLLAGRVMIKDLRYHSSNQSFRAIKCRVTWRYWRWRTREDFQTHVGEEESKGAVMCLYIGC